MTEEQREFPFDWNDELVQAIYTNWYNDFWDYMLRELRKEEVDDLMDDVMEIWPRLMQMRARLYNPNATLENSGAILFANEGFEMFNHLPELQHMFIYELRSLDYSDDDNEANSFQRITGVVLECLAVASAVLSARYKQFFD